MLVWLGLSFILMAPEINTKLATTRDSYHYNSSNAHDDHHDDHSIWTNHYICWENRADVIVQLINGDIQLLSHDRIWQLKIELVNNGSDRIVLVSDQKDPMLISQRFPDLPNDIHLAFTMPDDEISDHRHHPGKTLFLKPPKYYLYENYNLTPDGYNRMQYWERAPFLDNRFTAVLHNTSLLLVAKQGLIPDGLKTIVGGQVFLFDTYQFPEWIGVFKIDRRYTNVFDWFSLRQLIPITAQKHNRYNHAFGYLAILDYGPVMGQYYCISGFGLHHFRNCAQRLRALNSAFNCSQRLIRLKGQNEIYQLWKNTGMTLWLTILATISITFGMLFINSLLLVNTCHVFSVFSQDPRSSQNYHLNHAEYSIKNNITTTTTYHDSTSGNYAESRTFPSLNRSSYHHHRNPHGQIPIYQS